MRLGFRIYGRHEDAICTATKLGFTDLEPLWSRENSAEFPAMARMASDAGIRLGAVLTGQSDLTLDDYRRAVDDCVTIGASSFTAHPDPLPPNDGQAQAAFAALFAHAAEVAEEAAIRFAMPSCTLGPAQWDLMFRLVPALGLKYDPSFSAQAGRNIASEILRYGKRIVHVHAKDEMELERITDYNSGIIPMKYVPAGMGRINWGTVIAALYEVGFDEMIAIEPHSPYWCSAGYERGLVLAKRHLEQFIA